MILLSGDAEASVESLANLLGIEKWCAGALPDEKLNMVREYSSSDGATLMVGDGMNDAAALALANVSLAPSTALDVTRVSAGIVMIGDNLAKIPEGIRLAKLARRRVLENFAIAACYNAAAIPLALMGLATPLAAAIAMSSSSIAVTLNSMRMR